MVLVAKSKPRINKTHKKRTGGHHRHTRHYTKHYYPYIPLVLVVGLGLLLNIVWGRAGTGVLGAETSVSAQNLLKDTNEQRMADSESNLSLNSQLTSAAQNKADDMVARNYWSHNTPDGRTPWSFVTDAGYTYRAAGENLAYGFNSSSDTLTAWMNSPEHRANILNANFSQVGFGIAESHNYMGAGPETVVVAMYGEPVSGAFNKPVNNPNQLQGVLSDTVQNSNALYSQNVSRVSLLSPGAASVVVAVWAIAACGLLFVIMRHSFAWRRVLVQGEAFIIKHRMFDVVIVSIVLLGFVLTRTAGYIY